MTTAADRADYGCWPDHSRGRLYPEPESKTRDCFQRDRDRIIHTAAFRRLEYKTQVFVNHEGDHYRTRLTHSLEVAQIARTLARCLALNEDLAEALSLAHDLGHTPFGHAGEDALAAMMAEHGGFDHNGQAIRIVTALERRYPAFDGLNLTWETLEGIAKHNGPLIGPMSGPLAGQGAERAVPRAIAEFNEDFDLELGTFASAEAQAAALADDIAYNNHDLDDGLRAGLFSIDDLADVPLIGPIFAAVERDVPDATPSLKRHEAVRRMIGAMVGDCLAESRRRIADAAPRSAEDVRALDAAVIAFSDEMYAHNAALKTFLFDNMYRHDKVKRMAERANQVVSDLFRIMLDAPGCLPPSWRARADRPGSTLTAQVVADYIAGMTDRFAFEEHDRLMKEQARAS
jgi:dGTPase